MKKCHREERLSGIGPKRGWKSRCKAKLAMDERKDEVRLEMKIWVEG